MSIKRAPIVCRPQIGLHTVDVVADQDSRQLPPHAWALVQSCEVCGIRLNEVSDCTGVFLAPGSHVLVSAAYQSGRAPGFKIQLTQADVKRLQKMSNRDAQLHLHHLVWHNPLFQGPPDMSQHPATIASTLSKRGS